MVNLAAQKKKEEVATQKKLECARRALDAEISDDTSEVTGDDESESLRHLLAAELGVC